MLHKRTPLRAIAISIFIIGMMFWNFSRIPGSECIRAIHIVTLLVCGAAIGVLIVNLFLLIRQRSTGDDPVNRS